MSSDGVADDAAGLQADTDAQTVPRVSAETGHELEVHRVITRAFGLETKDRLMEALEGLIRFGA